MRVSVEPTYDMTKILGTTRLEFDVADSATVADVIANTKSKVGPEFDKLMGVVAIAVNGVLVNYKRGLKTRLAEGDAVSFVKASAGG